MTHDGVRLTSLSHGAGCACKLDPALLDSVLGTLGVPDHPDLLVGTDHGDDALVWRRPDGRSLIATVDFFTPIVDDPRAWGRIAATNAASDVYAMGGVPLFALNVLAWPAGVDPDLLLAVIQGGNDAARAGGWVVAGGHSVDGPEPLYGQAVVGEIIGDPLTNVGAVEGDVLLLTKPLGTGIAATAIKRSEPAEVAPGGRWHVPASAAIDSMCRLNDVASAAAVRHGVHAMTDVTGFGLVGHARRIAEASDVVLEIDVASLPRFDGIDDLIAHGMVPGGTQRNLDWLGDRLDRGGVGDAGLALAADPQSSGGLLMAVDPSGVDAVVDDMAASGVVAAVVGRVAAADPAGVAVRLRDR